MSMGRGDGDGQGLSTPRFGGDSLRVECAANGHPIPEGQQMCACGGAVKEAADTAASKSLFDAADEILTNAGALDQARAIRDLRDAAERLSRWEGMQIQSVIPASVINALDIALAKGNRP